MNGDLAETIGKRIRASREKYKISQKELAEKVGVSAAAINQFEKWEKKPSSVVLKKIALELGVSTDYLLGSSDDEDIFVSEDVAAVFRDFKGLGKDDREIILGHIEFLKSKGKKKEKEG